MSNSPEELQNYLKSHSIENIFKEILSAILMYKPADPICFMLYALKEFKRMPEVPPAEFGEFFKMCARKFAAEPESLQSSAEGFVEKSPSNFGADFSPAKAFFDATAVAPNNTSNFDGSLSGSFGDSLFPAPLPEFSTDSMPKFNRLRRGSVSSESLKPSPIPFQKVIHAKSAETRTKIEAAIEGNLLFKNLDVDQREDVIDAMFEIAVPAGVVIIRQGEDGDNFYVVETGSFDIFVKEEKVTSVAAGGSFGELALMYNAPRAATVVASEDSVVWAVDRVTFRRILTNSIFQKRQKYEAFLKSVPIFEHLCEDEISKIADALVPCEFAAGEAVINQGDVGHSFYIVTDGEAEICIEKEGVIVSGGSLHAGDYFGEMAMLNNVPRAASVLARSEIVRCISLDRSAFVRLLGPVEDVLKRNMESYMKYEELLEKNTTAKSQSLYEQSLEAVDPQ